MKDFSTHQSAAERIRYLIRFSRMTQSQFAERIGVDPSNLSKHLSGRLPISEGLLNRIVVEMGVSKQWLRDGTDVPFAKPAIANEIVAANPIVADSPAMSGVPVYDIDVTAGAAELSRMFTVDRIVGVVDLPQLSRDSRIVRVSGDSMEPTIRNGGYIAIRRLTQRQTIFWGQIYVVVLEDFRMVKFLRRHADKNMVVLHSANPDYDDMDIARSDILDLYVVENILNFDIRC
ncbi:MAG: LexA family transcriptional regulator [Muribaculaceae bacterium]|nr:LexA family transcriptional regulator [Muribaculaceae bacterium]MBQ7212739.1 LexA family transcriptional regulator [Muribaculaceae bacterium]